MINDFVENLKLNAFIRDRLADSVKTSLLAAVTSSSSNLESLNLDEEITSSKISFWSSIPSFLTSTAKLNSLNIKLHSSNQTKTNAMYDKCMTKRLSYWQEEESCESRQAYICEYDAISPMRDSSKKANKNNLNKSKKRNRLIRVACGSAATLFSDSTTSTKAKKTISSTVMSKIKSYSHLMPKVNSIKNTQKPLTNLLLPYNINNKHGDDDDMPMMILTSKETLPLIVENKSRNHVESLVNIDTNNLQNETSFLNGTDLGKE
jgi:hypothetical protein